MKNLKTSLSLFALSLFLLPSIGYTADETWTGATYADQQMMISRIGQPFENQIIDRIDDNIYCLIDNKVCYERFWFATFGGQTEILNTDLVSGLDANYYGGAIGLEQLVFEKTIVGAAVGYTKFNEESDGAEISDTHGSGLIQGSLYIRYDNLINWRIGAEVDYGRTNHVEAHRTIEVLNEGYETVGDYNTGLFGAQIRGGYDFAIKNWLEITPTLGYIFQHVNGLDFSEDGVTGFELNIASEDYTSSRSQLGLRFETAILTSFYPVVYLAWEHEFSDTFVNSNASIDSLGDSFEINGTEIGRNAIFIRAGGKLLHCDAIDIGLLYEGRFAKEINESTARLEVSFF